MSELTPKLGIKKPLGNETVSRAAFNENWDIIDQKAVGDMGGVPTIQAGLDAEKPAAGTVGRLYVATDKGEIYRDTGTAWELAAASRDVFASHSADYANPHRVEAEQVFSIGGIPSDTAFPTTPANYTLFFRTDLKKLFIYLP